MQTLRVRDVLHDRILIGRESARQLLESLRDLAAKGAQQGMQALVIDFTGIEGMAPSFLDELLSVLDEVVGSAGADLGLFVANPPARLSLKFEAVARSRERSIEVQPDGSWLFRNPAAPTSRSSSK